MTGATRAYRAQSSVVGLGECVDERGDVGGGDRPDLISVDAVVVVGQDDPEAADVVPGHLRMASGGRLVDDLEQPLGSPPQDGIRIEHAAPAFDYGRELCRGAEDVADAVFV